MIIVDKGTNPQTGVNLKLAAPQENIDYEKNIVVIVYKELFYGNNNLVTKGKTSLFTLTGSTATAYIAMSVAQRDAEITARLTAV